MSDAPWFDTAFQTDYLKLYSHRTDECAIKEVEFISAHLNHITRGEVLDLCCGNGRHVAGMIRLATSVVGLDYSRDLLNHARSRDLEGAIFVRADMRELPFAPGSFDVVTSFFTSFGYFKDAADDASVLSEISRALRPRGELFVDFLNARRVRKTLVPLSEEQRDGALITQRREIIGDRVEKRVTIRRGAEPAIEYTESVRLYELDELVRLLERAGLTVHESFGDFSGSPCGPDAERVLLFAVRDGAME